MNIGILPPSIYYNVIKLTNFFVKVEEAKKKSREETYKNTKLSMNDISDSLA